MIRTIVLIIAIISVSALFITLAFHFWWGPAKKMFEQIVTKLEIGRKFVRAREWTEKKVIATYPMSLVRNARTAFSQWIKQSMARLRKLPTEKEVRCTAIVPYRPPTTISWRIRKWLQRQKALVRREPDVVLNSQSSGTGDKGGSNRSSDKQPKQERDEQGSKKSPDTDNVETTPSPPVDNQPEKPGRSVLAFVKKHILFLGLSIVSLFCVLLLILAWVYIPSANTTNAVATTDKVKDSLVPEWIWYLVIFLLSSLIVVVGSYFRYGGTRTGKTKSVLGTLGRNTSSTGRRIVSGFSDLVWRFRGVGFSWRAVFTAILAVAGLNALVYWYSPDLWLNAWRVLETVEEDGATKEMLVFGWKFWAFWLIQVLGVIVIYFAITSKKNGNWKLATAVTMGSLFLIVALFLASNRPGEFKEGLEIAEISLPTSDKKTEEKKWSRFGTLSWQMPLGMANPLYTRKDGNQFATDRVEILRNDNDIFEYVVFSRYGGIQTKSLWVKKDEFGRWWTEDNNNIGRKPDEGEWYLEPDGPGRYKGAWRSQAQTGNRWVSMELRLQPQ